MSLYEPWQLERHSVKPGLTGPWQVECRTDAIDLREHVGVDIAYARRVTLRGDLHVLLRTPYALISRPAATERRAVINGRGASCTPDT
jgi:lipopolysaccharide/colanic/teichoic acid biosynthesis glycosyltransferase